MCGAEGFMPGMRSSTSAYNMELVFWRYGLLWKCWRNFDYSSTRSCC